MAWVNNGAAMMKGIFVPNAKLEADRTAALAQRDADEDAEQKKRNQAATFEAEKKRKRRKKRKKNLLHVASKYRKNLKNARLRKKKIDQGTRQTGTGIRIFFLLSMATMVLAPPA